MKRRNAILILAVVVLISIVSFVAYDAIIPSLGKGSTTTTCPTNFVCQPVGDIIISNIAKNYGGGVSNLPLNLTVGETTNLTVSFYPTVNVNVTSQFQLLSGPGGTNSSSAITASFTPERLSCLANVNTSTVMTVHVSSSAPLGQYTVVVSFQNSSYSWGTNIQVNVESS